MSNIGTIQINEPTYNAAVEKIEKANNRIEANNANITVSYEKCDMSYLNQYVAVVERLQTALLAYYNLVAVDIKNLRIVRDNLKEVDK